ncbi:MAG: helix-turn-helix transcriptional regulator [Actinobacteria bacterium]|nr:helix-turn-helix transcriptional regulator [Actinomycetota bacterium]
MDSKYTDDYKYMADRLKAARIEAGLGQGVAARLIDKSQSYISKIEAGLLRLDLVQLNELAKLYEKSLDYFLRD